MASAATTQLLEKIETTAAAGDLASLQRDLEPLDNTTTTSSSTSLISENEASSYSNEFILEQALCAAARRGHVDIVAYLLEQRGCVPTSAAIRGALQGQHWDVGELLLRSGWDINQSISGGNTLPVMCVFLRSKDQVQWCLEHGADPMIRSAGRNQHMANWAGRLARADVLDLLRAHGADFCRSNALHEAAGAGDAAAGPGPGGPRALESMAWLLDEAKVPINLRRWEWDADFFGANAAMGFGTALHAAVEGRRAAHVRFLLERGADPRVEDTKGRKPVDLARESGFAEGLALLGRYD